MTKKKKPKKATGFKKHILRNLTLLGVVGVSFAGGAWWVATTPSATATEAVGLSNQTQDFIDKISGVAQELSLQYDLYPSVMIAQAILESQSGTSGLSVSPYYNLFGVKGQYNGQGATFQTLEDDGKGIDYEAIRAKAVRIGQYTEEEAAKLGTKELLSLIFSSGFSTLDSSTEDAGRGVGLDIIKDRITALGGKIGVSTQAGAYTRFSFTFPKKY